MGYPQEGVGLQVQERPQEPQVQDWLAAAAVAAPLVAAIGSVVLLLLLRIRAAGQGTAVHQRALRVSQMSL